MTLNHVGTQTNPEISVSYVDLLEEPVRMAHSWDARALVHNSSARNLMKLEGKDA